MVTEDSSMKKTYEKPALQKREALGMVAAGGGTPVPL